MIKNLPVIVDSTLDRNFIFLVSIQHIFDFWLCSSQQKSQVQTLPKKSAVGLSQKVLKNDEKIGKAKSKHGFI